MKKNFLYIMCIFSICITICVVSKTYSRYAEHAEGVVESHTGNWSIKLNNTDITKGNTYDFAIDNITILGNDNVLSGKIAPGLSGYFDINIDPSNTDVSVRYDITIDTELLKNSKIKIENIYETGGNTLIQTGESTYTGIILLSDIKQNKQNTIRIEVTWENNNEEYEDDLEYAKSVNNILEIPMSVSVKQYIGEEITPYN